MKNLLLLARLFCFFAVFVSFSRAAADVGAGQLAVTLPVPSGLSAAQVQKSILLAGTGRGWTAKDKSDGQVVLFLENKKWKSTMTVNYDATKVEIFSNSGQIDKNGQIKKQELPSWLNYLKQDIVKHMGSEAFAK